MQKQILYHFVAFLVVAIWGSTFVFTKLLLLSGLSPAQIFTLRFIIAYVGLLGIAALRRPFRWFAQNLRDELLMLGLGLMGGSLYFLLFAALLISIFYRDQRLCGVQIAGSLLAAVGVAIVELNGHFVLHLSPTGDALAFAACLCWAGYSLLMIPACKRYDTLFITRKLFFYGLLTMIPYYIVYPEWPPMQALLRPDTALELLCLARVATKVRRTPGSGLPFGADADDRNFKALFLDTGLAALSCGLHYRDVACCPDDQLLANRGAISEQFVGQELLAARETWEPRELFYWARESRTSNAEVDYLGASGGHVFPIEVKSGTTGRMKSMHQFLEAKSSDFGLRFNADRPSYVEANFPDNAGVHRPFRLLSLPLYLASESRRLVEESI